MGSVRDAVFFELAFPARERSIRSPQECEPSDSFGIEPRSFRNTS
jgi:hypothetical protein